MGKGDVGHPDLTSGSDTDLHSHAGGGGGVDKHMDTKVHSQSVSKAWEPHTFSSVFPSVPIAIAFGLDPANPGKKAGVKDVTAAGCSVYYELVGDVVIFAREVGYE